MKLQCDLCCLKAASLFCFADEAALCDSCDHKIHFANRVASRHCRFSLVCHSSCHSTASSHQPTPLCDICQKKKGILFCKEDRSVLCKDCDLSVHGTSDLRREHARYLLTGFKLPSEPIVHTLTIVDEAEASSIYNVYNKDEAGVSGLAETDSNANSTMYTEYSVNADESAWHMEQMLFDNSATTSTPAIIAPTSISNSQYYQTQHGDMNDHASLGEYPFWVTQGQSLY